MPRCTFDWTDEVVAFLSSECTESELDSLPRTANRWEQEGLDQVMAETSEQAGVRSKYIRSFRFGECIALAKIEIERNRVTTTECFRRTQKL